MNLLNANKVKGFFPNHTMPCIKNFILIMGTLLQSRTVCLYKCRDKVGQIGTNHTAKINSSYMRLIRFFKMKYVAEFITGIGSLMLSISETDLTYLIVDRSNWKRGKKNFNLLTIGTILGNVFSPLYWIQLDKRGNSNTEDRKTLLEGLIEQLSKFGKTIKGSILLADREFIGQVWFEYLLSKNLSFVIRLRERMYFELQTYTGKKNFASILFKIHRTIWNIQHSYGVKRHPVHLCND
jgi:hypothetical protein